MHLIDIAGRSPRTGIAISRSLRRRWIILIFSTRFALGELIVLEAQVNRAFHTSIEVGVEVFSEDFVSGKRKHTTTAFLNVCRHRSKSATRSPCLRLFPRHLKSGAVTARRESAATPGLRRGRNAKNEILVNFL